LADIDLIHGHVRAGRAALFQQIEPSELRLYLLKQRPH